MRVCFFRSDKPREGLVAEAFAQGVRKRGDVCEVRIVEEGQRPDGFDAVAMVGVKSKSLYYHYMGLGVPVIYVDKGYSRQVSPSAPVRIWEYWRFSVGGHNPTKMLMSRRYPGDRAEEQGFKFNGWNDTNENSRVVFAGSSSKYHSFHELKDPTTYASRMIRKIRKTTSRPVVYRPKPSWKDAVPIEGTTYSYPKEGIEGALKDAFCLVTHGSNACFESVLSGVPCVILGDAVAKPISSVDISRISGGLFKADDATVNQWLSNLAYYQWTMPEMSQGHAWDFIKPKIFGDYS